MDKVPLPIQKETPILRSPSILIQTRKVSKVNLIITRRGDKILHDLKTILRTRKNMGYLEIMKVNRRDFNLSFNSINRKQLEVMVIMVVIRVLKTLEDLSIRIIHVVQQTTRNNKIIISLERIIIQN
jgi:hypothetical protein